MLFREMKIFIELMSKLLFIGCKMFIDCNNIGSIFHFFVVDFAGRQVEGVEWENAQNEEEDGEFYEHVKLFKIIIWENYGGRKNKSI